MWYQEMASVLRSPFSLYPRWYFPFFWDSIFLLEYPEDTGKWFGDNLPDSHEAAPEQENPSGPYEMGTECVQPSVLQ